MGFNTSLSSVFVFNINPCSSSRCFLTVRLLSVYNLLGRFVFVFLYMICSGRRHLNCLMVSALSLLCSNKFNPNSYCVSINLRKRWSRNPVWSRNPLVWSWNSLWWCRNSPWWRNRWRNNPSRTTLRR